MDRGPFVPTTMSVFIKRLFQLQTQKGIEQLEKDAALGLCTAWKLDGRMLESFLRNEIEDFCPLVFHILNEADEPPPTNIWEARKTYGKDNKGMDLNMNTNIKELYELSVKSRKNWEHLKKLAKNYISKICTFVKKHFGGKEIKMVIDNLKQITYMQYAEARGFLVGDSSSTSTGGSSSSGAASEGGGGDSSSSSTGGSSSGGRAAARRGKKKQNVEEDEIYETTKQQTWSETLKVHQAKVVSSFLPTLSPFNRYVMEIAQDLVNPYNKLEIDVYPTPLEVFAVRQNLFLSGATIEQLIGAGVLPDIIFCITNSDGLYRQIWLALGSHSALLVLLVKNKKHANKLLNEANSFQGPNNPKYCIVGFIQLDYGTDGMDAGVTDTWFVAIYQRLPELAVDADVPVVQSWNDDGDDDNLLSELPVADGVHADDADVAVVQSWNDDGDDDIMLSELPVADGVNADDKDVAVDQSFNGVDDGDDDNQLPVLEVADFVPNAIKTTNLYFKQAHLSTIMSSEASNFSHSMPDKCLLDVMNELRTITTLVGKTAIDIGHGTPWKLCHVVSIAVGDEGRVYGTEIGPNLRITQDYCRIFHTQEKDNGATSSTTSSYSSSSSSSSAVSSGTTETHYTKEEYREADSLQKQLNNPAETTMSKSYRDYTQPVRSSFEAYCADMEKKRLIIAKEQTKSLLSSMNPEEMRNAFLQFMDQAVPEDACVKTCLALGFSSCGTDTTRLKKLHGDNFSLAAVGADGSISNTNGSYPAFYMTCGFHHATGWSDIMIAMGSKGPTIVFVDYFWLESSWYEDGRENAYGHRWFQQNGQVHTAFTKWTKCHYFLLPNPLNDTKAGKDRSLTVLERWLNTADKDNSGGRFSYVKQNYEIAFLSFDQAKQLHPLIDSDYRLWKEDEYHFEDRVHPEYQLNTHIHPHKSFLLISKSRPLQIKFLNKEVFPAASASSYHWLEEETNGDPSYPVAATRGSVDPVLPDPVLPMIRNTNGRTIAADARVRREEEKNGDRHDDMPAKKKRKND